MKKSFSLNQLPLLMSFLALIIMGCKTISSPLLWSYLALGKYGFSSELFCCHCHETPVYLFNTLLEQVWQLGGASLATLLNILGLMSAFYFLLKLAYPLGKLNARVLALLLSLSLLSRSIEIGPNTLMFLFVSLTLFLIKQVKNQKKRIITLLILQLIWVNMHVSFILGPILVLVSLVEEAYQQKRHLRPFSWALIPVLLLISVINPNGAEVFTHAFTVLENNSLIYWHSLFTWYLAPISFKPILYALSALFAIGFILHKKTIPLTYIFSALIGMMLIWTSPKSALVFVGLSFPFMTLSIQAIGDTVTRALKNGKPTVVRWCGLSVEILSAAIAGILIVSLVTNQHYVRTASASRFGLGVEKNIYSSHLDTLLSHKDFPTQQIISQPADGGYLTYQHKKPLFLDYLIQTDNKDRYSELNKMLLNAHNAYESFLEKYEPEAFVLNALYSQTPYGLVTLLNRGWNLIYFDGVSIVLLPKDHILSENLAEIRLLQQQGLEELEQAHQTFLQRGYQAGHPIKLMGAANVFLHLNRLDEARYLFNVLLEKQPDAYGALQGLGIVQLYQKEYAAAMASLETVLEVYPLDYTSWYYYGKAAQFSGNTEVAALAMKQMQNLEPVEQINPSSSAENDNRSVTTDLPLDKWIID